VGFIFLASTSRKAPQLFAFVSISSFCLSISLNSSVSKCRWCKCFFFMREDHFIHSGEKLGIEAVIMDILPLGFKTLDISLNDLSGLE